MNKILLLLTLSLFFVSCMEDKKAQEAKAPVEQTMQDAAQVTPPSGIAEENDMCICTKDYRPVCGENGQTYPNPCQAGCEKVKVAHDGPCADK